VVHRVALVAFQKSEKTFMQTKSEVQFKCAFRFWPESLQRHVGKGHESLIAPEPGLLGSPKKEPGLRWKGSRGSKINYKHLCTRRCQRINLRTVQVFCFFVSYIYLLYQRPPHPRQTPQTTSYMGYLAHKKTPAPRTPQQAFAYAPYGGPGGGGTFSSCARYPCSTALSRRLASVGLASGTTLELPRQLKSTVSRKWSWP